MRWLCAAPATVICVGLVARRKGICAIEITAIGAYSSSAGGLFDLKMDLCG
jgi:hypothetical protein